MIVCVLSLGIDITPIGESYQIFSGDLASFKDFVGSAPTVGNDISIIYGLDIFDCTTVVLGKATG